LIHNLGAVFPSAPHACSPDTGHVCDNPSDILYPYASGDLRLSDYFLDVGHDDYYAHSGDWFDVQGSLWLLRALEQRTLGVTVSGRGSVEIVADMGFATTREQGCTSGWDAGAEVTLETVPAEGYAFDSWSGDCSSNSFACTLTRNDSLVAGATFAKRVTLWLRVVGRGQVLSSLDSFRCARASCRKQLLAGDGSS
jgi:hypothetical protein